MNTSDRRHAGPTAWHERVTASPAPEAVLPPVDPAAVEVSIVLVAYGSARVVLDGVTALVRSLVDDPDLAGTPVEVLVVDHPHPAPGTSPADLLALHTAGVRVVRVDRNLGFGGGNELGIALARGRVFVLLNPDVVPEPGWLPPLLTALDDPTVGIAAPVLVWPDGRTQEAGVRLFRDAGTAPETELDPAVTGPVDVVYSSAACWAVRREVLEQAGGFDAAFHPAYYEDVDLALRVRRLGLRTVVCPEARLVHLHGGSTAGPPPDLTGHLERFRARWSDDLADLPSRPHDARGRLDERAHHAEERVLLVGPTASAVVAPAPGWEVTACPATPDDLATGRAALPGDDDRFRFTVVAAPEALWSAGLDVWCDRWQPLARRATPEDLAGSLPAGDTPPD
jgi:GT2 family glycosyltransferase